MKKIAALLCGAVMAFSSVCSATISADKIALDQVEPGMKVSKLVSIYGQPTRKKGDEWTFRHFKVEIDDENSNIIEEVKTTSAAFATPNGVRVGQKATVLNRAYGVADRRDIENDEEQYEYYSHDYSRKIEFKVVNGIITEISCEYQVEKKAH